MAQEAFLAAYRKMATYRGEASFKTWLLTIAWRQAVGRRRRLVSLWRRFVSGELPEPASPSRTQERVHIEAERTRHVMRLVRALPARLRDPLLLCAAGDQTYQEIAVVLGIPEGTLKWRVSEARRRLRQRLAAMGYGDE